MEDITRDDDRIKMTRICTACDGGGERAAAEWEQYDHDIRRWAALSRNIRPDPLPVVPEVDTIQPCPSCDGKGRYDIDISWVEFVSCVRRSNFGE